MLTKLKRYINSKLKSIKKYSNFDVTLVKLETINIKPFGSEKIYDIKFILEHEGIEYTFETANYYQFDHGIEIEDIYYNINSLLNRFKFLLEHYDQIITIEEVDDEIMTIDQVADSLGMEIDDDGDWLPKEFDCYSGNEVEYFSDDVSYDKGIYIYDNIDDNGKFYWEDDFL